jgi:hypothetical protein
VSPGPECARLCAGLDSPVAVVEAGRGGGGARVWYLRVAASRAGGATVLATGATCSAVSCRDSGSTRPACTASAASSALTKAL